VAPQCKSIGERLLEFCAHQVATKLQAVGIRGRYRAPAQQNDLSLDEIADSGNMSGVGSGRTRSAKHRTTSDDSDPFLGEDGSESPSMRPISDGEMDRQPLLVGSDDGRKDQMDGPNRAWFSYVRTGHFWVVLLLGYVGWLQDDMRVRELMTLQTAFSAVHHQH
jgi:hypothetical protein